MTDSLSDSLSNPKKFWKEAAEEISWNKKPELAFNPNNPNLPYPQYEWFPNSTLNMCYNCIDRHVVAGHGSQIALYYDSPVSITKIQYSYSEMQQKVSDLAKLFLDYKIKKGDIVLIYMPMIPEAVFSMLACARVGAIHTVVFGGFGPNELAKRIQDSNPVLILTASCGIEVKKIIPYHPLLAQALKLSKRPKHILVYQRPMLKAQIDEALGERDWNLELERTFTSELTPCVPVDGSHSLYLLYTSGSTGAPKGILRETGPHAVSLLWSMKNTFGLKPGMCMFTNSDIGCSTILFEGKSVGTPDAGALFRVISEYKVNILFCAPTALRAMTQEDPKGEFARKYNLKSLEAMFCAGERLDPTTLVYYQNLLKVPIRDNYWQTELGSPCVATSQLDKTLVKVGSSGLPVAGFDFHVMKLEDEELGDLVIKLPLPPGCLTTMFKNHEKFVDSYLTKYKGYYDLADSGMIDKDGYVFIMGRTDDIINIAGHRLSTGGMEEVIASHPNVAEVAVVAVKDILKGEIPLCFAVLKSGVVVCEADLIKSLQQLIRERIGAFACFKRVVMVKKLPKTRSGKILRRTLKSIGQGDVYKIPATIDDVDVLSQIESSFLAESSKL